MRKTVDLLRRLGIPSTLKGHCYICYGVYLIRQNPEVIQYVTKELYPEIAEQYEISWESVEHAIRTAVNVCWERGNRGLLNEIAGYELRRKPTASEFIGMISFYIRKSK